MLTKIESNSIASRIIREEESILRDVLERLLEFLGERAQQFQRAKPSVYQKAREELLELRDLVAEAKSFDVPQIMHQMQHVAALANALDPNLTAPPDPASPYFAHISLEEDQKQRDVLIGKRSFVDSKNRVQIVDWRNAPVSKLYYSCDEGSDYDISFGQREIEGIMRLRRALSIEDGKLKRIHTPQGNFLKKAGQDWYEQKEVSAPELRGGQGKATRAPAARSRLGTGDDFGYRVDKHLPEIAALIDPEQFERITQPASGLVILQGGAGSGKTTVALHRVAYLNYQNRNRYHGDKVLITVFNQALANYIERVLPSLDVPEVKVWTYHKWAGRTCRRILPHIPFKNSTEAWDQIPSSVSRLKKHPALLQVLKDFVEDQTAQFEKEFRERFRPEVFLEWQNLREEPLIPRLQKVLTFLKNKTFVADESATQRALTQAKDIVSDWAEIMTNRTRLRKGLEASGERDFSDLKLNDVISYCSKQISGEDSTKEEDAPGDFDALDYTLLLRLSQLKSGGIIKPSGEEIFFNHAVIDEAQDLSPLEIQVVIDATNDESVTLAGDTAQKLVFDNGFHDWEGLMKALGKEAIHIEPLRIAYRSTHEINLFAREVLGPLAPKEPVKSKRHGVPVEVFIFREVGETVAFLAQSLRTLMERERQSNVALLALQPSQADLYYEALVKSEIPNLRRIRNQEFPFTPGIDVTDINQIKGLEYDYVVILEATLENYPNSDESRHLLHIAATRAAHQLWVTASGKLSSLIHPRYLGTS